MSSIINITSKRLLLRQVELDDAEAIFSYRSDSVTNKYQGWKPETIKDVHDFINYKVVSEINIAGTWCQLVIIKKEEMKIVGDVGIHFIDPNNEVVELGCTLSKSEQSKGLMTEALTEVIKYLFIHLKKLRIIACIDPGNISSINLFKRLGFKKEEYFQGSFSNDEWSNTLLYSILKDDWKNNS